VKARIGWKALTASEYQEDGFAFLSTPNIKGEEIDFENVNYISQFRYDESPELRLAVGDVLLAKDGSTLGISNVVSFLPRPATVNGSIAVIRPHSVDSRFLRYTLAGNKIQALIEQVKDGMGVPHLFQRDINRLPLQLPLVDQQRRIADFLDDQVSRIDQAVRLRQKQRGVLATRLDAAILEALLPRTARLLGRSPWIVQVPAGWRIAPLRAAWQVVDCKHRTPNYLDSGFPVVSPGDVTAGRLDLTVAHRFVDQADFVDLADPLRRCLPGDLVYSRNASAGRAAYVETSEPFTMGQDVCRITSRDQDQLFLMYVLNFIVTPQLDAVRVGSTFTRINVDEIRSLKVPIPAGTEQTRLARRCDDIWFDTSSAQGALRDSLKLLGERKRALITAAVTGEFDVTTASGRGVA